MNVSGQTVIKNNYDSPITTADGRTPTETTNANGFVQGSETSYKKFKPYTFWSVLKVIPMSEP